MAADFPIRRNTHEGHADMISAPFSFENQVGFADESLFTASFEGDLIQSKSFADAQLTE